MATNMKASLNGGLMGKILLIVVVPLVLIISLFIYSNFQQATLSTWEQDVNNESVTGISAPQNVTLDQPPVVEGSLTVYNQSDKTDQLTSSEYKVYSYEDGKVEISTNVDGDAYFYYKGHGGSGFSSQEQVNSSAYSGFSLAGIIPLVLAGIAILMVVIGAFAFGLGGSRRGP